MIEAPVAQAAGASVYVGLAARVGALVCGLVVATEAAVAWTATGPYGPHPSSCRAAPLLICGSLRIEPIPRPRVPRKFVVSSARHVFQTDILGPANGQFREP